ncbi:hypothetical protein NVT87_12575 [Acinetobacter radioresistens]|jgi:hypothetical protein|uniref:hypothetical protein n=1 Tax=Acinetobacter radioresistens TaxID=40216 RepID=UPI002005F7AD|nr:hypothetical protein [Acinetobacter radioresistens]MCK4088166.1 hypothetical protein [Acinetobacter radioresistens]MCX0331716.1 hypothetical protein [Acinetobacter radioresistens]
MKRHVLNCTVLAISIGLTACNDSDDNDNQNVSTPVPAIPVNNIDNPVLATPVAPIPKQTWLLLVKGVVMTYKMLGINNKGTQATTLVFTPEGTLPAKG